MVKKHTKRCSLWLAIKEMPQDKTMRDYMPTEMILNVDKDAKKLDHSDIDGGNVKYAHAGNIHLGTYPSAV